MSQEIQPTREYIHTMAMVDEHPLDKYYNEKDEAEGKIPKLMSFQEQFPSLKGKGVTFSFREQDGEHGLPLQDFTTGFLYSQKELIDNCFDKQKVREAIKKCVDEYVEADGEYPGMINSDKLLERLGL